MNIYSQIGVSIFCILSIGFLIRVIVHVWSLRSEAESGDEISMGVVTIFLLSVLIGMCGMLLYVAIVS